MKRRTMRIELDEGAFMPTRAHETDAGYDLYAREDFVVPETSKVITSTDVLPNYGYAVGSAAHDTGVHIEIPRGFAGLLVSKSGLNVKYDITSTGLIDSGYTGSIVVKLYNHSDKPMYFHKGEKITQIVIIPVYTPELELVEKLDETDRGDNGFGSSGK